MIANLLNTLAGLGLVYATVLHPTWVERQVGPFLAFAILMLVLSSWARHTDVYRWFSTVNIASCLILAVVSLLPLHTMPDTAFWSGLWIGILIPTVALWAALYRPARAAQENSTEPADHEREAGARPC